MITATQRRASLDLYSDPLVDGVVDLITPADTYTFWAPLQASSAKVEIGRSVIVDGNVCPGMLRLQLPGERVRVTKRSRSATLGVSMPKAMFDDAVATSGQGCRFDANGQVAPILKPNGQVETLVRMLLSAFDLSGSHRQLFIDGLAHSLLALLLSAQGRAEGRLKTGLSDAQFGQCVDYAEARLAAGLDLTEWAAALDMSGSDFARRFQQKTGVAPYSWFMNRRIECAKEMLSRTRVPTVEIALETGFCSQSHFTEAFRRRVGMSPGRWRALGRVPACGVSSPH